MAWSKKLWTQKFRALGAHLGLSALVFVPFLYAIWVYWFPPPLFFTDGGWQGVRIMLFVDLCIGPALTFLVFDPGKTRRALAVDFGVIALVQAAALLYGYMNVEGKRPLVVAFSEGRFVAVTKDRYVNQTVEPSTWERLGDRPPYWVFVRPPKDDDEAAGLFAFGLTAGNTPEELAFLYEPLRDYWDDVVPHALSAEALRAESPEFAPAIDELLRKSGVADADARFLRLAGYFRQAYLLFDGDRRYRGTVYGRRTGS